MFKKILIPSAAILLSSTLTTAASAADLGGDCCADLEERVAVLEATTARKGNRKVSLTISGWVSSQLYYWDDGDLSDLYVTDQSTDLGTRLTFSGSAKINTDWSTGYVVSIGIDTANALASNQLSDDSGSGLVVEHSYMWVKNEKLGKISWGLQSQASDNRSLIPAMNTGTLFATAGHVMFDGAALLLRPKGGPGGLAGLATGNGLLGQFASCVGTQGFFGGECSGDRTNSVRYDSPTIGGLTLSASWGEDDFWDVAFSYVTTVGDFKLTSSGSYSENTDEDRFNGALGSQDADASYVHVGATIFHQPTGLFLFGTYGHENSDVAGTPDSDHWYIQPGLKTTLNSLGKTTFFGEYGQYLDAYGARFGSGNGNLCGAFNGVTGTNIANACSGAADTTVNVTGSELTRYGFGVVQDIDAASMQVWVKWRHHELEVDYSDNGVAGTQDFEDIDIFIAGGVILF